MNGDRALAKKLKDGVQDLEKELNEANSKLKSAKNTVALVDVKLKIFVMIGENLHAITYSQSDLQRAIESLLKELKGQLRHGKRNGSKDLSKLAEDLQAKQFKDRIQDLEKELIEANSKLESANEILAYIENEFEDIKRRCWHYVANYQCLALNLKELFRMLNGQLGDGEHNGSEVKQPKDRIQDLEKELAEMIKEVVAPQLPPSVPAPTIVFKENTSDDPQKKGSRTSPRQRLCSSGSQRSRLGTASGG